MPGGRSRATGVRGVDDVQLVAAPPRLERPTPASAGAPSAPSAATAWSRRSPGRRRAGSAPGRTSRRGRWPARCRSPPCRPGGARPRRAPTPRPARWPRSSRGRRRARRVEPGGAGVVEPAVGGDRRRRRAGIGGDGAPVERRGAGDRRRSSATIAARSLGPRFLRRHYPDQVLGSAAATALSARRSRELPVLVGVHRSGRRRRSTLADDRERGEADDHEDHPGDLGDADRLAEDEEAPAHGDAPAGRPG